MSPASLAERMPAMGEWRLSETTAVPRASRPRANHCPTKPAPPVTRAVGLTAGSIVRSPRGVSSEVGLNHHLDQLREAHVRRPTKCVARLRCVGNEEIDLRWTEESIVLDDELAIIESNAAKGRLAQLAHRPCLASADHVVVRRVLLQHEPHRAHVIAGKTPIAPRLEIAEAELSRESELDARDSVGDFARHELETAAGTLVVEENSRDRVQRKALAVVHGNPVAVHLRHAVRASRIEWRGLPLRRLVHLAEHLARAGLIEARVRRRLLHRFEHARDTERGELAGEHGLVPR